MEIHHKTAFEAKSLDFLAFCLISLILTEMCSYILLNLLLYTCTCINFKREKEVNNSESIIKSIMYVHIVRMEERGLLQYL